MMGHTHALSGAAAGLAVFALMGDHGTDALLLAPVFAAVGAGAALMPDLDHPSSKAARSLGPLSGIVSGVVTAASGGHRKGTHSIIGIAVAVALFAGLTTALPALLGPAAAGNQVAELAVLLGGPFIAGFVAAIGVGTVIPGTIGTLLGYAAGAGVGLWLWFSPTEAWIPLTVAFGIGYAAHMMLGDLWTKQGVPLAWPVGGSVRLAALTTNSTIERAIIAPAFTLATIAGLIWVYRPAIAALAA